MQMLAMVCTLDNDSESGVFLLAAHDDMVFVPANQFPPDLLTEATSIAKGGKVQVIGAIVGTRSDA